MVLNLSFCIDNCSFFAVYKNVLTRISIYLTSVIPHYYFHEVTLEFLICAALSRLPLKCISVCVDFNNALMM